MSLTLRLLFLVRVAAFACTVVLAASCLAPGPAAARPFDGRGMWIWYVSRSDGGNPSAIAAQARSAGIQTLFIKSGDGGTYWSQFTRSLVRSLHAGGVNVCAWQYVYGTDPSAEAAVGALAVRNGADCLVIDAEAEYEGRYAAAQTYIDALRAAVGAHYPVGLASFPYVDNHPSFPYSVFLGHRGAQFNLPQMYWRDIGTSVEGVYQHTYTDNRIYRRPIRPLGETENGASGSEIALFRGLSVAYQARGLSWWDFAWTAANGLWSAISGPYTSASGVAPLGFPLLSYGSKGDMVLWMQELLASAIPAQQTTGTFASQTLANLRSFQVRHGIPPTGETGPMTWQALLRLPAVRVTWAARDVHSPRRARATGERGSRSRVAPAPQSAALPALMYEIHKPTGTDGGYSRRRTR
jgi:peptidoglycan hydrolase-like protein with peptidoglycan-binding domain